MSTVTQLEKHLKVTGCIGVDGGRWTVDDGQWTAEQDLMSVQEHAKRPPYHSHSPFNKLKQHANVF